LYTFTSGLWLVEWLVSEVEGVTIEIFHQSKLSGLKNCSFYDEHQQEIAWCTTAVLLTLATNSKVASYSV
jgi:hypothetical protein